ncbi:porin [Vibrio sp. T187]|uniref:porin n=1 Tax=Vibrio TaxID=662 RepID=UPI0010C992A3|nr:MULTISPECIES: porin [Vibrio]MBW3696905.1 porin [Vibrio sp. T187]
MKKSTIALSIFSALLVNTTNAAEVFNDGENTLNVHGRVQGMYYVSDDKEIDGDNSYLRVGLDGESKINDDVYAFGLYELQLKSNTHRDEAGREDDDLDVRKAYVGLGSDMGTVSYGRQFGAVTLVSDYTDIFPEFGNEAAGVSADLFGTGRSDSVLKVTSKFSELNVHANYQAENEEVSTDARSYGIAADYAFPMGFKLAAGYNEGEGATGGDDAKLLTTALSYQFEKFYAAALYSTGENFVKADGTESGTDYVGIEAVATYKFTDNLLVLAGYNNLEQDKQSEVDVVDSYSLGVEYNLNDNFKTLAEYKFTDIDSEEDILALAIRYAF